MSAGPHETSEHSKADEPSSFAQPGAICDDATSIHSSSSFSTSATTSSASSADADPGMFFFGNPKKNMEALPLVHLWLDLANRLKQEDIPSPVDLFAERDAIVK